MRPAAQPSGAELPDFNTPPPPLSLSEPDTMDDACVDAPAPREASTPDDEHSTEAPSSAAGRDEPDREDTDVFEISESSMLQRTKGILDTPTEVLPRREHEDALADLQEPPHPPQRAAPAPPEPHTHRPLPRARKKPARPRPPGALQRVQPAEKGAQLLAQVRAGESIHDH